MSGAPFDFPQIKTRIMHTKYQGAGKQTRCLSGQPHRLTSGVGYAKIIYGKKVKIMKFTKKQQMMLDVTNALSNGAEGQVFGAGALAQTLGVSARYLEQLLFVLRKAGFVAAKRGAEGGYHLTQKGRAASAADILFLCDGGGQQGDDFAARVAQKMRSAACALGFNAESGIYLDNAATTAVDEDVAAAMTEYMCSVYGNASSLHSMGRRAQNAVDEARERVADCLNVKPWEIYFTGGGSESDNWAIKGVAEAMSDKGRHIVTTAVEHPAVLESCRALERRGFEVTYLPVDSQGIISLAELKKAVREDTILISVMSANNESGALMPVAEAGAFAKERGITFHTDAVQAAGHSDLNVQISHADLLSLSGHKFYAPKGVGVLYKRNGVKCARFMDGGEQERGRRAGTLNTPGIVALGLALERACAEREKNDKHIAAMRDLFEKELFARVDGVSVLSKKRRLASHSCVVFEGIDGHVLAARADERGVYASVGSACSSGSAVISHVLLAMGLSREEARSAVRFSFGKNNTEKEAVRAAVIISEEVKKMRREKDLFLPDKGGETFV